MNFINEIRYLFDENVDPIIRTELLRREPNMVIWKIGDPGTPPRGSSDSDILIWCEENSFILVTYDRKSMPRHLKEHLMNRRHVPGIFALSPNVSIGATVDDLSLIWSSSQANEYQDLIIFLPFS